ncbi:hypothetical protein AB6813_21515 [bacterium RCC_150]
MGRQIYDAAFAAGTPGDHHKHLGKFWWVNDATGYEGTWTRDEAVKEVFALGKDNTYVKVDDAKASVWVYFNKSDPSVEWIQTEPDGTARDNLITLAQRRAQGLPNNK